MRGKLLVGFCLFALAGIAFVSSSGAPPRVHVAVLASWFLVAACASLVFWLPNLQPLVRFSLLGTILLLGAWLLSFSVSRVVAAYEMTFAAYLSYLGLAILVLCFFLGLTWAIARAMGVIGAKLRKGRR